MNRSIKQSLETAITLGVNLDRKAMTPFRSSGQSVVQRIALSDSPTLLRLGASKQKDS
jgi:hypothetical protein